MSGIYEYLAGMLPRLALLFIHCLSLVCLFSSHEAVTRGRLESHKLHPTRAGFVTEKVNTETWVNILPKNPYLAKRVFLENLILLKSKKDDFPENLPNC